MGGIQTEVPTAPEEKQFSPTQEISEAHTAEKHSLAEKTEELAKNIRESKTYQELSDVMHKGEQAFESIVNTGLQAIIAEIEPTPLATTVDTVPTGKEGGE